jgi:hypothetical protein
MGKGVESKSKLPEITAIDDKTTQERAAELLRLAAQYKEQYDTASDQLDDIRKELTAVATGFNLPGMRDASIGFYYNGRKSSRTLSVAKLLENGVSPEAIRNSYEEGREWDDVRIVRLKK